MKKIAVLLLVLSVASLAQASFFLTINGQDVTSAVVPVGQSVTVGIHSTDSSVPPEPTAWGAYGMYHELTLVAVPPSWATGLGTLTNGSVNANAGATAAITGGGTNMENNYWTQMNPAPTPGLWFEWTFTNTLGDGDIYLLTWGEGWASTVGSWDSVAISSIPEPTTMTLLGLGLVALFRKK
jgi:hypothetical protein